MNDINNKGNWLNKNAHIEITIVFSFNRFGTIILSVTKTNIYLIEDKNICSLLLINDEINKKNMNKKNKHVNITGTFVFLL